MQICSNIGIACELLNSAEESAKDYEKVRRTGNPARAGYNIPAEDGKASIRRRLVTAREFILRAMKELDLDN